MGIRRIATRVEAAATAFERGLIVVLLAFMAGAVFLDALHRGFAAEEGRLERLVIWLMPAPWEGAGRAVIAPALLVVVTFLVLLGALRTRTPARGIGRTAALAAAGTVALAGATQLLVRG